MKETTNAHPPTSVESYFESALSIGRDWLNALSQHEPRRTGVVAMMVLVADRKQYIRAQGRPEETLNELRSMLCRNCAELHPALTAVCRGKPISHCWLLKGYRCRVA